MNCITMRLWLSVALVGFVLAGCSQKLPYPAAKLMGKVSVDGVAVSKGQITFTPRGDTKGPVCGAAVTDGKYICENVPKGKLLVQFIANRETGKTMELMGRTVPLVSSIVPEKDRDGHEIDVAGDNANLDFNLTTK